MYDYSFHGKAKLEYVQCPALLMGEEGEAATTLLIAQECYRMLLNPDKKLVIFTTEQGGKAPCQVNNLELPNGVMLDWLDEVLE